jgi:hypothetical protein
MSELLNTQAGRTDARLQLLATVSSLALLAAGTTIENARAQDTDRPTVWIEVGGQFEHMNGPQDRWTAPFENISGPPPLDPFPLPQPGVRFLGGPPVLVPFTAPYNASPAFDTQNLPPYSFGGEGKITFAPSGTDWVFSASARFGRSNGHKQDIHSTEREPFTPNTAYDNQLTPYVVRFFNGQGREQESHTILDFQVGKDVGLGLFGSSSTSVVEAGVRYAQFALKTSLNVVAIPTAEPYSHKSQKYGGPLKYQYRTRFQSYVFNGHSTRSFHGIGPSLSWNGTTPLAGNADTAEFTLDWGINGALLFGRQKAVTDHKTTGYDRYLGPYGGAGYRETRYRHGGTIHRRSHSVTIPNIGGFAGLSLKFPNAKVSLGYRADAFFGAMDAGIDTRRSEDMIFHGPFASISVGFGG